jgi:Nif-specific regulatory protein
MATKNKKTEEIIYQQLFEIGKRLLTESEVDKMLSSAMDSAIQISGAERGLIILFDNQGEKIFQTARKLNSEDLRDPEFEISQSIIITVKAEPEPICIENALESSLYGKKKSVEKLKLLSVICLPLLHGKKLFGVIYLDNRTFSGIFQPETFHFIRELTNFISLAAYQALERKKLQNQKNELEEELRGKYKFESIIGHHPKMVEILKMVSQVADTDATVLIQGETGTGKELIAQALHYNSSRKDKPFVPVNCGAIPEHLLESELFGHVRGAFTGAIKDKAGWFESANGGTIFLDEINDMSPALQVRLLRVLQTGEYSRVGSTKICHCDVRVVSASSKNLQRLIKTGDFREEVYYRLNVVEIELPPLRDRSSDIPLLAHFYLKEFTKQAGKKNLSLSAKAESLLLNYNYPGNVRELVNVIQRAVVLVETDTVDIQHLPATLRADKIENGTIGNQEPFQFAKQRVLENFEKEYIIKSLNLANGNITQAAHFAGMHVKNFFVKVRKYGINPNKFKNQS